MFKKPNAGARPAIRSISAATRIAKRFAAAPHAEQHEPALRVVRFDNLVRQSRDDARNLVSSREDALRCRSRHAGSFNAGSAASVRASSAR